MAPSGGVRDRRPDDRRRHARVGLSVPVQFGRHRGEGKGLSLPYVGQSRDVGTGGVYLTTQAGGPFVPGEILKVSIPIQWEARRSFPFSRITGFGRVVRVDALSSAGPVGERGLALAFCQDQLILLGAVGRS